MHLLKFENYNCQPCVQVSEYLKDTPYTVINPFEEPDKGKLHKVRSLPTLILMDGEIELDRTTGFKPKEIDRLVNRIKGA